MTIVEVQLLMFWYEDKTQWVDSFKAENEFETTFTHAVAGSGIITIKRNNAFGILLFGFCPDINRVFRSVTHQIIFKRNDFSNMIIKSGARKFKVDVMHW